MLLKVRHDEGFEVFPPISILEKLPSLFPTGNHLGSFFVTMTMQDVELICGEQFLEDVLVSLEDVIDHPICFIGQVTCRPSIATGEIHKGSITPRDVLKHLHAIRVAEELAEEARDLGMTHLMGAQVTAPEIRIDEVVEHLLVFQKAENLTAKIFLAVQTSFFRRCHEKRIRVSVSKSIGNGITRFPG